jgi:hypothetical protein
MSKKVFFLGSGFSKALDNYPTLLELSNHNLNYNFCKDDNVIKNLGVFLRNKNG